MANDTVDNLATAGNIAKQVANIDNVTRSVGVRGFASGVHRIAGQMPLLGSTVQKGLEKVGVQSLGGNIIGGLKGGAKTAFKIGPINSIIGGVVLLGRGAQAIGEFRDGDTVGGTGKVVRGAVEAGVIALNFTGLTLLPELGLKLLTGKFLSDHIGDFAENTTTKLLGGTKEENYVKNSLNSNAVGTAIMPQGINNAGLNANVVHGANNAPMYVGGLPPNTMGMQVNAPQAIQAAQVMPAQYSARAIEVAPSNYWQNKINNDRQIQQQQQFAQRF